VFVASLPNDPEKADLALSLYNYNTEFGREIRFNDRNKLYLGSSIAQQEDGSVIQVGQKVSLNDQRFTVVGIAERKGNPFFDGAILISEPDAIDLFNLTEEYDLIGVQIQPGENLQEVVARVERTMRRDRDQSLGEEDFEISTPDQFLDSLNSILMTVQILLVGIAAISLFVGGIGIANTMYTAVLERNREIGIMKAIGATDNEVLRIFLIESGLLGLAGGVLGVLIGAGIAKGVEFVAAQAFGSNILQASIDPMVVVGVLLFAFILGAVCGTLPARQAARLRPVEALRK
jgi:putative ABC transport system permease protein